MARLAWVLLAFGAAACVGPDIPEVVTGDWGGLHLGMIATETGADLEYDCATGRITGAVRPDANGRFSSPGKHFPGRGGPIGGSGQPEMRSARYEGTVRGTKMIITVTLTDTNEVLGLFVLYQGASPRVFKCL